MLDDETGAEPRVLSASIADPFLLLIRDDSSVFIAQIDSSNELEELEKTDKVLLSTKWVSGCLYTDKAGTFSEQPTDKGAKPGENILMFLLSATGALHVGFHLHYNLRNRLLTKGRFTGYRTSPNPSL